ncbi:MAG TPA: NAD(P)-binding domain-containing protein [Bryobacteraceae bacterium]|nr:NAD(P)-binding domain-containing protein [Bryobacteraceae bacterium]
MVIGVVGSGNVGAKLTQLWKSAAHDVRVAGRQNCAETVRGAEVVALCVPWSAAEAAVQSCGDLGGKVVIDCTNPVNERLDGLVTSGSSSAAEQIQALAPAAFVVKAFNSIGAGLLGTEVDGRAADGLFCGDSLEAKQVAAKLISAAGLRPVDVGPLRNARYLEAMAMLWIDLAINQKHPPTFAFTVAGWQGAAR